MLTVNGEKEGEILRKFQERVSDVEPRLDEITCLRFLVAREFDLDASENMLRQTLQWRKTVGIENYTKWTIPDLRHEFEFEVTGVSHNGGPVMWIPLGRWNARYWVERQRAEDIRYFAYHILETALTKIHEMGCKGQAVVILGMETLTYYKVAHIDTLKELHNGFSTLERSYPEIIEALVIVNATWIFNIGFNFIKPILSARTLAKLNVYGSDRKIWLPALRAAVPDSAIPSDYLQEK